ncbi:glycosyltransferase [Oenococcus kitaharae]|uniref:Glycosyl transferase group 1 n=1 Tax=Oenococcus kitaharae DSM 17330 TaxID=1045004 RepID=G9WIQ5_9LACO|nr:glycosyltransferase [Oenococcus kitaharae]EHN58194.1 glycosyl transferase group 1 [Oenococcus kitaharae DSM 17330]
MKIIFFQSQFKMGGQQKIVRLIAQELNKDKDVDVTVYYENHNYFDLNGLKIIRPRHFIQIINLLKVCIWSVVRFIFDKRSVIDRWHLKNVQSAFTDEEYDLAILCNPYILFVDEIRKITGANKVICWTHNLYENYTEVRFKSEKQKLFSSMRSADQIVCLESYTASRWKKINNNVVVIHNPVTIDAEGEKSSLNSKIVSFTGRIQIDSKGLDYLCDVATYLDGGVTIEVAGSGSKKEETKFKKLIKQKRVSDKIKWVGALSGENLKEHYWRSTIFLMCSRYEGFPLVAAEAMSFGLPIIAFDIPSLEEVTSNGTYGVLVTNSNTKEMAEQISKLLENRNLLLKYQRLSLERARSLSVSRIKSEWIKKVLGIKNVK